MFSNSFKDYCIVLSLVCLHVDAVGKNEAIRVCFWKRLNVEQNNKASDLITNRRYRKADLEKWLLMFEYRFLSHWLTKSFTRLSLHSNFIQNFKVIRHELPGYIYLALLHSVERNIQILYLGESSNTTV